MLLTLGGARIAGSDFGRPKPLLLLAYLIHQGPQLRSHVSELFWPGSEGANRSLTTTLVRLRRAAPGRVHADETRMWCDLASDAQELRRNLADGDLESALALYRGPFLSGLELPTWGAELEEWLYAEREALAEELRSALLKRAYLEAGRGRLDAAAAWAERAAGVAGASPPEPTTLGRLHALLRAADHPLAARLEAEAATFELALAPTAAAARSLLEDEAPPGVAHDLPTPGGPFVGRDVELAELHRALASAGERLITLVGPGGTGKTRLALQAARESLLGGFTGVYFVALEAARSTEAALAMIAETLGIDLAAGEDLTARLARALGKRRVLLVLDNLEQLKGVARPVTTLLERCENLKVLATSRERLEVSAERVVILEGLSYPSAGSVPDDARRFDAVSLFALRAGQATPGFELRADDLEHVTRLCELLQGAPLGIELAASLTRLLSCREIAAEAERTFDVLERRSDGESARHRSLRSAFTHSWSLLDPAERDLLARLSVFRGGFEREGALAVTGGSGATLLALSDKSLLNRQGDGRWLLHPVTRQYAAERLHDDKAALAAARESHAQHFMTLAENAAAGLRGADQVTWLARLAAERDNLRAALDWSLAGGEAEMGLRLAVALQQFWWIRGPYDEGCRYLTALADLEAAQALPLLRARALHRAGTLFQELGQHERAAAHYDAARQLAEAEGDVQLLADTLHSQGLLAGKLGRNEAHGLLERSLELQRGISDRWGAAATLNSLGIAEAKAGRYERARSLLLESLSLKQALGDVQGIAYALNNLGALSLEVGETTAAKGFLERSLELKRQLGDATGVANSLNNLGHIEAQLGRYEEAREVLLRGLDALPPLGGGWIEAAILTDLVVVEQRSGRPERALRLASGLEAYLATEAGGGQMPSGALQEARLAAAAALDPRLAEQLQLEGGSLGYGELLEYARQDARPAAPSSTREASGAR